MTRAAAEVSARKEDLLISETNLAQQETVLKNALSRNGVESVWLDQVHIIPLDSFEIPKTDELKPTAELVSEAIENRPEITQTQNQPGEQQDKRPGHEEQLAADVERVRGHEQSGADGNARIPTI